MKAKILTFILVLNFISVTPLNSFVSAQSLSGVKDDVLSGSAVDTGSDSVTSGSSTDEAGNIITISEVSEEEVPLQFFPVNSPIEDIELYNYAAVITKEYLYVHCEIKWNSTDTVDTSTPGRKTLRGYLIPPEGCVFENNLTPYVEIPLIIYDETSEGTETLVPPAEIDYYNDDIIVLTPGADITSYLERTYQNPLYTEEGDFFYCDVEWEDITSFSETGYQNVKGRLMLPGGIKQENADDTLVYKKFYIMKDDKIYIEPYYFWGSSIMFPWIKEIEDPENIKFYYSFDMENWNIVQDDYYGYAGSNYLFISTLKFEPDNDYYFRLFYNNEYTDIIKINLSKDEISCIGGDRDGGDNNIQEIPPVEQPDKTYNSSGHGMKKPAVNEKSDETSTTVSGKRLEDMAKNPGNKISVEKSGIEVKIPDEFIEDNNIKEDDAVTITIDKEKEDNFSISVDVNGNEIEDIPHTEVYVPTETSKEPQKLVINKTGEYSVNNNSEAENKTFPQKSASSDNNTNYEKEINQENSQNTVTTKIKPFAVISVTFVCSLLIIVLIILWRIIFYGKGQR